MWRVRGDIPGGTTTASCITQGLAVGRRLQDGIAAPNTKFTRVVWNRRREWSTTAPIDLGTRVWGPTKLGRLVSTDIVGHVAVGYVDAPFVECGSGATRCNGNTGRPSKHGNRLSHVGGNLGVCSVPWSRVGVVSRRTQGFARWGSRTDEKTQVGETAVVRMVVPWGTHWNEMSCTIRPLALVVPKER